jgi:hypothetical protein
MPMFNNDAQLEALFLIELKGIINDVAKDMLQKLYDSIEQEVYGAGTPTTYHRLRMVGGLLGSFEKDDASIVGREVESTIDQNPMTMVNDPENHIHGSLDKWKDGSIVPDIRDIITDIIIEGRSGSRFGDGFWREPRDFWSSFIRLIENGTCDMLIQNAAKKRGITLVRVS